MNYRNEVPKQWPKKLAVDIEATGLDPYASRILSVAVADMSGNTWLFLHHEFDFKELVSMLENPTIIKIAHNAIYEIKMFKHHLGADMRNIYDTMLAEKILAGGKRQHAADLGSLLALYCGVFSNKDTRLEFVDHPGFDVIPPTPEQIAYMLDDVRYLHVIKDKQVAELVKTEQVEVAKLEFNAVNAFAEIELGGMQFDIDLWFEQEADMTERRERAKQTALNLLGKDYVLVVPGKHKGEPVIRAHTIDDEDYPINVTYYKHVQLVLADFGVKVDSTRKEVLEELVEIWKAEIRQRKDKQQKAMQGTSATDMMTFTDAWVYEYKPVLEYVESLLEVRKWDKRLGYNYPKYLNEITGKIHPSYHQAGTDTGRVSCSDPNMQQVPRPHEGEPNMRHLFTADTPQYTIIRADYSQQEPRVFAQICQDKAMLKACSSHDVYIEFAKIMYGREVEKGSEERQTAKTFVLAKGYGAGDDRLAYSSGLEMERVVETSKTIARAFPQMIRFASKMEALAKKQGFVTTVLGRRRYADPILSYAESVNTPVQGTAADMFKKAAGDLFWLLTDMKKSGKIDSNTRIWNVVHDEIEVMCHVDEVDTLASLVTKVMEDAGKQICPDVTHIAEWEVGYRWDK